MTRLTHCKGRQEECYNKEAEVGKSHSRHSGNKTEGYFLEGTLNTAYEKRICCVFQLLQFKDCVFIIYL